MNSEKGVTQIAACDSQTLMWAFPWAMPPAKKTKKTPGQDVAELRQRARWLLKELEEKGIELYVPSIVVVELLAGVEKSKHAKLSAEFSTHFFCPPFDNKAWVIAAQLWQFERGIQGVGGLPESERTQRRFLRPDTLIVASAKASGVTIFYSHDAKCRRLAEQAGMNASNLPTTSGKLFETEGEEDSDEWE